MKFHQPDEDKIRPEIRALIKRSNITKAEYEALRGNSWEWEAIIPALDDDAFIAYLEHNLENCSPSKRRPCVTYDDALVVLLAPELLRRFRKLKDYSES